MIVIGGSIGGMTSLQLILQALPPHFAEPIVAVLHRARDNEDLLTPLLQRVSLLKVCEITDKMPVESHHVYIGPPDYHVLVEADCLSLSVDEPVLYARPSIDVLFESAAMTFEDEIVGVILSGAGRDGAHGAATIEAHGGRVFIEDPATAHCPILPMAARGVTSDAQILPVTRIASELCNLFRYEPGDAHASRS